MSVRSDLLAAARQLVITVGGATDAKVILAGAKGPRPAKPYVTVRLTSPGGGEAPAERLDSVDDGTPQTRMRERRQATVSYQGYGAGAATWLEAMQLGIDSPASLTAQATLGVAASVLTPARDISELLDTEEESRFSFELALRYRVESTPADAVELLTAEVAGTATRYTADPDPMTFDTTVTL